MLNIKNFLIGIFIGYAFVPAVIDIIKDLKKEGKADEHNVK